MSSHYIIRDDQEPALLLYEIAAVKEEAIFSLLEWNPLVIIHESAVGFVLHNKIKVDAVIAVSLSTEEIEKLLEPQQPFDILPVLNLDEDLKEYLKQKGMHALDIIGEFGLHTLKLASKIESAFPVNIFSGNIKYVHARNSFRKWASPGRGFRIVTPYNVKIETSNLAEKDEGIYIVEQEGIVEIKSKKPVWVGEAIF